jgi:hypothetical protein
VWLGRLVIAVPFGVLASAVAAGTIHVDAANCPGPGSGTEADPYCSIQTAIDNAADDDEIVVAPGTYFAIDFLGKAITLRSSGGPEVTIIDAEQSGSGVVCERGEDSGTVLDGFTVTGGLHPLGGGMRIIGSSPRVAHCTFRESWAHEGGGIYLANSSALVTDCTFFENHAAWPIAHCHGGGMHNADSNPIVRNCVFLWNEALDKGAGMYNENSHPLVVDCVFAHNFIPWPMSESTGGGMYNAGSHPLVTGCTFAENEVLDDGGAIYNDSSDPTVVNCILHGDFPNELSGNGSPSVTYSNVSGGFPGAGNIDLDPLFVDPGNGDYRLSADSPCIDAGDNAAVPEGTVTDLDGNPRFLEIPETPDTGSGEPPVVDLGAYEALGGGCLAVTRLETACHGEGPAFTVNVEGLNACTGGTTMLSFTGSGGAVGEDFCTTILVTTEQVGYCCSTQVCVPVPDCAPAPPPCDIDGDFEFGVTDLLILLEAWGANAGHPADLDGDGVVSVVDFLELLSRWGPCP